jgi:non-heme Fe2+,alpha-ketoglutarate-dependent halogenase
MAKKLTDAQLARYRADGVVHPVAAMSGDEALALRRRLEAAEAERGAFALKIKIHLVLKLADELVHHPAILDAVEDILGPDILAWDADFIIKDARDPRFVSWHQDLTYWGLEPHEEVTAWVALSASTTASGCMRVSPGTHRGAIVPHADTFAPDNMLTRGQAVAIPVDESRALDIELAPGQFSLHDGKLVHGSRPNRTDDRRIGFAIRYVPTLVRPVAGPRDSAMLVRGVDAYRHFDPEPRPGGDFEPAQLAVQSEIERRRAAVLYRGAEDKMRK